MLILFGKKISTSKKIRYALTEIFGIGYSSANKICNFLSIPQNVTALELTEAQQWMLSTHLKQHFTVENKLRKEIRENIRRHIIINSIKGFRHRSRLPVRGQRTHSNAKTCKRIPFTIS